MNVLKDYIMNKSGLHEEVIKNKVHERTIKLLSNKLQSMENREGGISKNFNESSEELLEFIQEKLNGE